MPRGIFGIKKLRIEKWCTCLDSTTIFYLIDTALLPRYGFLLQLQSFVH